MKKLTLRFKKNICQVCQNCNPEALKLGSNHCSATYANRNGHCLNLIERRIEDASTEKNNSDR